MQSIPYESLTKTFQDSIEIALKFDIRYIWIDSLCIVQDDHMDWEEQAGQMAAIYENCLFVIAATASSDGNGGCFKTVPSEFSSSFESTGSNGRGDVRTLCARKVIQHPDAMIHAPLGYKIEAPLIDRAWCFQENLLGPRILHFSATELFWECNAILTCQCGQIDAERYLQKSQPTLSSSRDQDAFLLHEWRSIVEAYSLRDLSYESDRLPALSGVAKQIQRRFSPASAVHNRYLAGLWERDLLSDLTYVVGDQAIPRRRSPGHSYRAPSWSWASAQNSVSFGLQFELDPNQETATVLHARCMPAGADSTGAVSGGLLRIAGPLIEVKLEYNPTEDPNPVEIRYYITHQTSNAYRPIINNDHLFVEPGEFHIDPGETIQCLWLGFQRWKRFGTSGTSMARLPREHFTALLLRSSRVTAGTYERIGIFNSSEIHSGEGWFADAPWTEITMV